MRLLIVALLSFGLLGCASAPTSAVKPLNPETAKIYEHKVEAIELTEIKVPQCQKLAAAVLSQWNWERALVASGHCVKSGDWNRVEELGQQLSTREPEAPWGPYYLGLVAKNRGQWDRALWLAELSIKRLPTSAASHYLKGQVLWELKETGAAVQSMERAIQLNPDLISAHLFLGQLYLRDQEFEKASVHFSAVLKSQPRNSIALPGLSESLARAQKGG
ncbi:MAG: tetratricopeptide repeat protein [Oligoflexia bacterium]|nr:tetratricopeptide repeat protein [Oligoflexia bacterium]